METNLIKNRILDFLNLNGFALLNQIAKKLELNDSRFLQRPLNELISEKIVIKMTFKGLKFYFLAREQMEVKNRIKKIKSYILKSIERYGPIKARKLVQKVKRDYDLNVSHLLIYRIAKELLNENKVDAQKISLANVYYQKGNKAQELIALKLVKEIDIRKRKAVIKLKSDLFLMDISDNHDFNNEEITIIIDLYPKLENIIDKVDVAGRSYADLFKVAFLLFIKRQIYFIQKGNEYTFEAVKVWLRLHEILLNINLNRFQGFAFKTYQHLIKQILNNGNFCNQKDRSKILNSPNLKLRIHYLITYFTEDKEFINKILKFIDFIIKKNYPIQGKDIKGITGGLIYIFSRIKGFRLTQSSISKKLNITEVTLRTRRNELLEYYDISMKEKGLKSESKPVENKKNYKITQITEFL